MKSGPLTYHIGCCALPDPKVKLRRRVSAVLARSSHLPEAIRSSERPLFRSLHLSAAITGEGCGRAHRAGRSSREERRKSWNTILNVAIAIACYMELMQRGRHGDYHH
jgi:hypothetical protein